ncbi:glycosyltransferase family 4 protein [Methanolobus sp.]|uniref:glycosyltransferase family 4 protein n=1 Tax=Methanolobus sp. TaxID=1874737 RepID=UPI0025F9231B|nr:glycosyltransferase family 4 protein [Methanolobus sp.]
MIEMPLIFYYPSDKGAPSLVGRSIFEHLYHKKDDLPFSNLSIFSPSKYKRELQDKFEDITIYTEKNICNLPRSIIHIPVSPLVFPNPKFLLHLYSNIRKYPLILNYHGDFQNEFYLRYKNNHKIDFLNLPSYLLMPYLLASADHVIVNSFLLESVIKLKHGIDSANVIPNAVDDYWFGDYTKRLSKMNESCNIFYHGRLSGEKGVDQLIQGLYQFTCQAGPTSKVTLYLAGEGPQRRNLHKLSQDLGISEKVIFLGNLDRDEIKTYLQQVDVAIYPSTFDNFPLSYLEAFACAQCPVYFSQKAGIYDFTVKDGYNLNSFEPNVDRICDIIKSIYVGEVNSDVVIKQNEFSKKYTWNKVINDYIKLYQKAIITENG